MKFVAIIFILIIKYESSCDTDNKTAQIFWTKDQDYLQYQLERRPLQYFVGYLRSRTKLKNVIDLKFPELHCGIEKICTTTKPEIENNLNKRPYILFCELYFKIEHKKEHVYTIDHLELWLFSHQNFTIHSSQLINKSRTAFFNIR